ncbi:MAG: hypothetical protein Q4P71_01845 [Actinomycetaceae bacterium]|nr:hypothetical protein [Actinomycetaceae bacterium]
MDKRFIRLWLSSTSSGIAVWALPFILGLGVAHDLWSASTLGWILGVRTAGFVIAVPIDGVLADQMSRSRVTFLSGTLATIATVMLALALPHSVFGAGAVASSSD